MLLVDLFAALKRKPDNSFYHDLSIQNWQEQRINDPQEQVYFLIRVLETLQIQPTSLLNYLKKHDIDGKAVVQRYLQVKRIVDKVMTQQEIDLSAAINKIGASLKISGARKIPSDFYLDILQYIFHYYKVTAYSDQMNLIGILQQSKTPPVLRENDIREFIARAQQQEQRSDLDIPFEALSRDTLGRRLSLPEVYARLIEAKPDLMRQRLFKKAMSTVTQEWKGDYIGRIAILEHAVQNHIVSPKKLRSYVQALSQDISALPSNKNLQHRVQKLARSMISKPSSLKQRASRKSLSDMPENLLMGFTETKILPKSPQVSRLTSELLTPSEPPDLPPESKPTAPHMSPKGQAT